MAELFHKTFSDALTGANGFDSVAAANGTIVHSAGAGLNGTSGGVTITKTVPGTNHSIYGTMASDFSAATVARAAWWTDLSALTIGTNNQGTLLFRCWNGTNSLLLVAAVLVAGVVNLRGYLYNDGGSNTNQSVALVPLDWIEVRVQRASDGATADGNLRIYCGGGDYAALGELVLEIPNILCYTVFSNVTTSLLGMPPLLVSLSVGGSIVIDEFTMRDDDTPILFGVSESTRSLGMQYVLNRRRRKSYCW